MGYTKDTVKGVSWLGFLRVAIRGVSYVRIAILARLLTPLQFGISDIALLVLGITEIFTETGINLFLIQQKEKIDKYINTAWIISLVRGFIISILILLSVKVVADFFNNPSVVQFLVLTAVIPIVRGTINPSVVKLVKDLNFKKEFFYRSLIFFVEVLVSVYLAFKMKSAIAIIAGVLAGAVVESIVSFFIIKPRPSFSFKLSIFNEIVKKGKWFTATGIFSYLYHNGDNVAVGRMLGASSLGIYQRVYSISILPITEVSDVIMKVTYAVFVKISSDVNRLRSAFIKSIVSVIFLVVPIGLLFFIFPTETIRIILGEQWIGASEVLKVLAVFGVLRAISLSSVAPFYALKRQDLVTRITFVSFVGLVVTIVPFVSRWGIIGAAYSALVGVVVAIPLTIYYLFKILK